MSAITIYESIFANAKSGKIAQWPSAKLLRQHQCNSGRATPKTHASRDKTNATIIMTECTHINRRPWRIALLVQFFTGKTTPAGKVGEIFLVPCSFLKFYLVYNLPLPLLPSLHWGMHLPGSFQGLWIYPVAAAVDQTCTSYQQFYSIFLASQMVGLDDLPTTSSESEYMVSSSGEDDDYEL